MAKLYVLKEEVSQVDYKTKVKYLYTSEVNRQIVNLVNNFEYVYLSNNFGVLNCNEEIEPYKVKLLNITNRKTWVLLTSELIHRICQERGLDSICFMFSGEYEDLKKKLNWFGYAIEQPLKLFRSSEMKLKWVNNEIQSIVCRRLTE